MSNSSQKNSARRYVRYYPSFFQGVYTEFTGEKPLPKALRDRPTIFVFGDEGVGKTILARHLMGTDHLLMKRQEVLDTFLLKVRKRRWMNEISTHPRLILESPSFLRQRPQILKMLRALIQLRTRKGLKTILLDSEDMGPIRDVVQSTSVSERATVMLRFPSGRGRYRFLARACRERDIPLRVARELSNIEPWTYKTVFNLLEDYELFMNDEEAQQKFDVGPYKEDSNSVSTSSSSIGQPHET